jgi:diamine N-acetyltransferase
MTAKKNKDETKPHEKRNRFAAEGKRVALRELRKSDLARTARWINDPRTAYFMGIDAPVTAESQRRWFEALQSDPSRRVFAISLRRTGRHVGNIALSKINARDRNAELNIFIGDAADRRKGYAREALILMFGFFFNELGMNRIHLVVHADNAAARRLYESCGMRREGLLREHECYGGIFTDKIVMGILRKEFSGAHSS